MKNIANVISLSRIGLSGALYYSFGHTAGFIVLYLLCGLSDFLDGYIARKTKTQSPLGAKLDSFADIIFFAVVLRFIALEIGTMISTFLPWLILIIFIRCTNIVIAAHKYHSFAVLHTWGNKATGLLLFITPLFLIFEQTAILWPVCIVAVLSAMEETMIHLTSSKLNINRRSLF